jgi:hypothetical protein
VRIARLAVLLGTAAGTLTGVPPAPAQSALVPEPAYYRPVVVDGFAFPVARSNWLSVIELAEDWHDPRFRLIGGRWECTRGTTWWRRRAHRSWR